MNRINCRSSVCDLPGFRRRNDQDVLVLRRFVLNERDLLMDVAFYAATERRIELRQIANFHLLSGVVGQARRLPMVKTAGDAPTLRFCSTISRGRSDISRLPWPLHNPNPPR